MANSYPKIVYINRVMGRERQYKCEFCGKHMVNKRIDVQTSKEIMSDFDIFFFHDGCLQGLKTVQILAKLYPDKFATLQENSN